MYAETDIIYFYHMSTTAHTYIPSTMSDIVLFTEALTSKLHVSSLYGKKLGVIAYHTHLGHPLEYNFRSLDLV